MSDIFISYSRNDSAEAEQLAELLASAGLSCWIDKSGIDLATSWSKEIVQAIDQCSAFVVLLSAASNESTNVHKEVSLASEKKKKILPLDLEPVQLSEDLQYALAGIQRAPMANIDAVIRALEKLGLEATGAPQPPKIVKERDGRKSLMILPFEDLSPTADNGWFADGLVAELISVLSNVKSLRVSDPQATKEFKNYKGQLAPYARAMGIRYFIQGSVRKFGDQIKIASALLDIETGDHLWQDSMKGTMNDIFDIQEKVAEKVVKGLKIHLASEEKKKLAERGTENVEAFELYMKANEYYARQTKEGFLLAIQLITEAIKLDPSYARAYYFKANALAGLYRSYDRMPALLNEAETLCKEALRIKPDLFAVYYALSMIYMHWGQLTDAEEVAREYIRKDPQNYASHFALGFFYAEAGQPAKAIAPYEEAVHLKPDDLTSLCNLVLACNAAREREECAQGAALALPHFERHLKLHPDDEAMRVWYASLLYYAGRTEEAYAAAMKLTSLKDGVSLFNTAGLFGMLGERAESLRTFRKAMEAGYRNIRHLMEFLTDEKEGILALQGTAEYEEVRGMVEALEKSAT